jgi:hypothetical protein
MNNEILTPEQFVDELEDALPGASPEEAKRLIEHARAWAIVYYEAEVPRELQARINSLEEENHVPVSRC